MKSLAAMFQRIVRVQAEHTAIVAGETALTYAELENKVAGLAAELDSLNAHPGDRIALLLPNGADFVIGYFAILTLGAIAVPLNAQFEQTELALFIDACSVSILITSREYQPLCENVLPKCRTVCRTIFVQDLPPSGTKSLDDFKVQINPHAPAMYQFSSGSTGQPKRIARSHANLLFELDSLAETLGFTSDDRFLGVAPFSHVNGLVRSMLACIHVGGTLYPIQKFDRRTVAQAIEKNRLTAFIGVPFMFCVLAQTNYERRPDLSSLRYCISASAPMPVKFNRLFQETFGMYVRQLYGSTETGTISVNLHADIEHTLESVGTPIKRVAVQVLGDDGRAAKTGTIGEVAVKSPAAITCYDDIEDLNSQIFRDGYFFTGDLGRQKADGSLYLVGRKNFVINKGGYKINPHEVEEILEKHPQIQQAVVIGIPTPYGDEKLKAIIVPSAPCTQSEIIEFCRGKIAAFKIPSEIEFRDSLPTTVTGKIRRGMLT